MYYRWDCTWVSSFWKAILQYASEALNMYLYFVPGTSVQGTYNIVPKVLTVRTSIKVVFVSGITSLLPK